MFIYKDVWATSLTSQELRAVEKSKRPKGLWDSGCLRLVILSGLVFAPSGIVALSTDSQVIWTLASFVVAVSATVLVYGFLMPSIGSDWSVSEKRVKTLADILISERERAHRFGEYDCHMQQFNYRGTRIASLLSEVAMTRMPYTHMKEMFERAPFLVNSFLLDPHVIMAVERMYTEDDVDIRQAIKDDLLVAARQTIDSFDRF